MSIKISFKKNIESKGLKNYVLFCDENFNISALKKYTSNTEFSYISDLLKTSDLKKNLLVFEVNSKKKIILISIKKNLKTKDVENLGAEFYSYINYGNKGEFTINADSIKSITINGNERIPDETILMFSSININDNFNQEISNSVLKSLYQTNFFKDVSIKFTKNNLIINVVELPIIENIEYKGIKAKRIKEILFNDLNLKNRSSYNEFLLKKDKEKLVYTLRELGYYFSTVDIYVDKLDNNKVNLTYQIDLGKKAKIKKISFIGNKIYKDGKLKSLITSEEFKFWL